ncbi:unnamed protein product [Urochloa humidicola]
MRCTIEERRACKLRSLGLYIHARQKWQCMHTPCISSWFVVDETKLITDAVPASGSPRMVLADGDGAQVPSLPAQQHKG